MSDFFTRVRACLIASDVDEKLSMVHGLAKDVHLGKVVIQQALPHFSLPLSSASNGCPEKPELVGALKVSKRGFGSIEGRAVMIHAIAHIEFNAINLALDAVQRFPDMPENYYADWLSVADEEAYHFELIRAHLRFLGADYGDYPAHQGLWEMAEKTAHDVLERMALVPRVLEARGLDVTPAIQEKLRQAGDKHAATILDIIFADEIGHVEVGTRWFHYLCKKAKKKPDDTFFALVDKHFPKGIYGPYNVDAREEAGFSANEIEILLQGKLKKVT
ncbi:MAG TPA: ferritin-like domain-containing protein [Ghiorsea sp.]|nr:ferritin-like domain-containing protein [Ghiorsea sp.]HIP08070.1 ferritin-like domain-containing protein [Mariprofundaceae bacterium]